MSQSIRIPLTSDLAADLRAHLAAESTARLAKEAALRAVCLGVMTAKEFAALTKITVDDDALVCAGAVTGAADAG